MFLKPNLVSSFTSNALLKEVATESNVKTKTNLWVDDIVFDLLLLPQGW